jgi:hypothetical protein
MTPENTKKKADLEAKLKVLTDKKAAGTTLTKEENAQVTSLTDQIEVIDEA